MDDVKRYSHQSISLNLNLTNIFLNQNKGKGPPGQTRSPGYFPEHPPDEVATPDRVSNPVRGKGHIINSIQFFKTIKPNFLTQLNFLIMKKQILFLAFFVLALIFAGTSSVLGQNLTGVAECATPTPINTTCIAADALHPVPGTDYEYEVVVPTPAGGSFTYHWFVTQDQTFITASALSATPEAVGGTHIFAAGTGYNSGTNTSEKMTITWKSFTHDAANPVFLVVYVENTVTCLTDNIEVYIIEPKHAFTLDIENLAADGTKQADGYGTCVSPIVSATYNASKVEMDYGTNYMFFTVNAANFTGSWQPSFQTSGAGIAGSRAVTAIDWAYPADAQSGTWNTTVSGSANNFTAAGATVTNVAAKATGGTVGAAGECIVVRVTVDNNQAETITDAEVTLAVDGVTANPADGTYTNRTYADINDSDCTDDSFTNDVATQNLNPRPNINEVTPAAPAFVPTNRD